MMVLDRNADDQTASGSETGPDPQVVQDQRVVQPKALIIGDYGTSSGRRFFSGATGYWRVGRFCSDEYTELHSDAG
jgi:hypothetical protein